MLPIQIEKEPSFLIAFALLFASAASADAYYLNAVYPQNNTWVTKSPYTFYWHNNFGSGTYWGGNSAYWYYSSITIYNHTWGYRNNDSWFYQPGLNGWGGYSQTLTESPLGSSYWRMRGYYNYRYSYQSYEIVGSYWVYRQVKVYYYSWYALSNREYVKSLYNRILGREPEPGGWDGWTSLLNIGYSRTWVRDQFYASYEFQWRQIYLSNRDFTISLYREILGRDPEPAGLAGWLNYLNSGGSRAYMRYYFGICPERQGYTWVGWVWTQQPWYINYIYGYRTRYAYQSVYTPFTGWSYFGVDLYAPVVTLTSPANGYSACNNVAVSFIFSAQDSISGIKTSSTADPDGSYLEIRRGSTSATPTKYPIIAGNNTITHTFTASDTYYWRVVATDRATPAAYSSAGARRTYSPQRSLTIDNTVPSRPALSYPIGNIWRTSTSVPFSWSGSTDVGTGVKGYYLKIDKPDGTAYPDYGGTYGAWLGNTTSRTVNGMPETPSGNYKWCVYAEDKCNNKSLVSSGDGRFRIDASVPKISIINPQEAPYWYNEYTASSINFKVNFTDLCSGVKQTRLTVYRPGPVLLQDYGWNNYAAYTGSAVININRDCKTVPYNGVWRARYDVNDHSGLAATTNLDFQIDVTKPTAGNIQSIDGVNVTANPIANAYPIVKVSQPVITWTAASEGAGQSGIANYFVKIWSSSGALVANATLAATATNYTPPALTSGLYYFEVSVTDKAKNGDVQNVDGISGNNQRFYTTQNTTYNTKRSFIVHLGSPYVTGFFPPLPKSGNGSQEWVVSANPLYSGQMNDTYGISKYDIRVYRKTGTAYSTVIGTYTSYAGQPTNPANYITTNNTTYVIPNRQTTPSLTGDGLYGFEIQAWDTATNVNARASTIAPTSYATLKYDFKVDITPPIKGTVIQPINDAWIVKPTHANPKRPTFKFGAADDNQTGTNDNASYSGIRQYMIRLWWDPTFPGVTSYAEGPFLGQPYKDYYIGTATDWTIPDDLKTGRYYWDVWVKDNANNWRWYFNATTGNYTITSVYGNTARPTDSTYKFKVDTIAPVTSTLMSNIGDVWIAISNPSFVWKASDDITPGSGRNYYELWLWERAVNTPIVVSRVPCNVLPGNAAAGGNITLSYGGGTLVSGAWPSGLPNNKQYFWDIKFVDIAGNYKWYKSGRVNEDTVYDLGESFRVDTIPPTVGGIIYPKNNEWIDQKGTRSIDENTGDAVYTPRKTPSFKFKVAKDNESGLYKYIVILKDARNPKVIIGDQSLTAVNTPNLFKPDCVEYEFIPPWGTGTWPVELKDGKYFWEVMVIDNTKINTKYYKSVNGNDANYETFRLDTIPPTLAVNKSEPIRAVAPATTGNVGVAGVGELLLPAYGYITTISVNLVNFQFSKAVDDINTGFNGYKLGNTSQLYSNEGPSGVYRYNFIIAEKRADLKDVANVNIWTSGYTIDTTEAIINFHTSIPDTIDADLNAATAISLYWSVHVIDRAGNEAQYVDRKMRVRHLPPGSGDLEWPPHGYTTTNRRPTFKWTK